MNCTGEYRHWSISEVLDSLDLALPNEAAPFVSKSAVAQARQRIGEAPLAWLFKQTARAWTTQDAAQHAFKGLSVWAMDGTTLRTPDSPANREHFGAQGYASGKVASYPQVRAAALTAIPTHLAPISISVATTPTKWRTPKACCHRYRKWAATMVRSGRGPLLLRPMQNCQPVLSVCVNASSRYPVKNHPGAHAAESSNPDLNVTPFDTSTRTLTERH